MLVQLISVVERATLMRSNAGEHRYSLEAPRCRRAVAQAASNERSL